GDVSMNGRKTWQTPNIDKLASQGIRFERFYTGAVVCAPSRGVLMTGKWTIHNGISGNNDDIPLDQTTLAQALQKHGYATALFGKWHHGRPRPGQKSYRHPLDLGFDEFFGFTNARHAWEHFPKQLFHGRDLKPVSGYSDTMFADKAVDFIGRHKEKPFFLYVAFNAPHFHVEAPEEDVAAFRGKFPERDPKIPINAAYAAAVTRQDKEVGRILKALDDQKLAERTLVIFTSDHGATFEVGTKGAPAYHDSNYPLRGQKRTLWEGGIRVPGAVRWTGTIPAGQVSRVPTHMSDIFPTALAAAGQAPEEAWKVTGANMLEVWKGKAKPPQRTLFWEWRVEGYYQLAAMRGDTKLVLTGERNPPELFDVARDPAERINLLPEQRPLADQLKKELETWLATETEASKWGRQPVKKPIPKTP
ncbi:MAG: sulfatase-like hydrolase/transferase, partial [Gemmataceae bacterium]